MPQGKPALIVFFIVLLFTIFTATPAVAATVELNVPIKATFDKAVASADIQTAAKLNSLYRELGTLLEQDRNSETKIKALHYRNLEALIALRKQIREIDADKLSQLEAQVLQTKEQYKPLFTQYNSINNQISLARAVKSKTLSSVLRTQADAMRPAIAFAREHIKLRETELKAAKDNANRTIKAARLNLETIEPLEVQIRSQRSATSLPRKSLSPVWTNFKYAIKKSAARSSLDSLATLVLLSRQISLQQQKIYTLEVKISDIITKTKAEIL
jgi:hypothetical protein